MDVSMGVWAERTVGFIGCGTLGQALLGGWLKAGLLNQSQTWVAARGSTQVTADRFGVRGATVEAVVAICEVVVLAIKPQQVAVLKPLTFRPGQLVISVMAGVSRAQLDVFCGPARVVRTMPNVGAQVGKGVTLVHDAGSGEDVAAVVELFAAIGHTETLSSEGYFHAATALAGSGPAYLFVAMEAMADGAVAAGLPRALASRLAAHTVLGAGALAVADERSPSVLKDSVASPGGTTIYALRALEAGGFRSALIEGIVAAAARSQELETS